MLLHRMGFSSRLFSPEIVHCHESDSEMAPCHSSIEMPHTTYYFSWLFYFFLLGEHRSTSVADMYNRHTTEVLQGTWTAVKFHAPRCQCKYMIYSLSLPIVSWGVWLEDPADFHLTISSIVSCQNLLKQEQMQHYDLIWTLSKWNWRSERSTPSVVWNKPYVR